MYTELAIFLVIIILIFLFFYFFKNGAKPIIQSKDLSKINYMKESINHTAKNIFEKIFFTKQKKKRINKTENKCRSIIEKIFNRPFPSVRPNFLRNPETGKNLELDCYNENLGIAIEYNGVQHYKYSPYFHKSKKDFYSQVHRDDWKRKICKEKNIKLIEIPYWVTENNLENFILNELKKKGAV